MEQGEHPPCLYASQLHRLVLGRSELPAVNVSCHRKVQHTIDFISVPCPFTVLMFILCSVVSIIRSLLSVRQLDFLLPHFDFASLVRIVRRIAVSVASLLVSFACITYLFALVGVMRFGGLINRDPQGDEYQVSIMFLKVPSLVLANCILSVQELRESTYGKSDYYALNFNTLPTAIVTLICLLHVSGWDVVCEGIVKVTSEKSRLYFVLWYFVGVLFLMNTVTSVFISAFVVEAQAWNAKKIRSRLEKRSMAENIEHRDSVSDAVSSGVPQSWAHYIRGVIFSDSSELLHPGGSSMSTASGARVSEDGSTAGSSRKVTFAQGGKLFTVSVPTAGSHGFGVDDSTDAETTNAINAGIFNRIQTLSRSSLSYTSDEERK
jgi:hypothetical protein